MKLADALNISHRLRQAINKSGKHTVKVMENFDLSPGRQETWYTVEVVRNPNTEQYEHMYDSHIGLDDVEDFLHRPYNNPPTDGLNPDDWEPLN